MTVRASLMAVVSVSLAAGICTGCCTGRLVTRTEFEELHPSVRWAYRSGSQFGLIWNFPAIIRQRVTDMHLGSGCVIVEEGGPGGDVTAPWEQTVALSLADGRRMRGCKPLEDEWHWRSRIWDGKDRDFFRLPNGLRAYVPIPDTLELFIGRRSWPPERYVRVARLPAGEAFGSNLNAISADKHTLIIGLWGGYVLCIDPTLIPELQEPSSRPASSEFGRDP